MIALGTVPFVFVCGVMVASGLWLFVVSLWLGGRITLLTRAQAAARRSAPRRRERCHVHVERGERGSPLLDDVWRGGE